MRKFVNIALPLIVLVLLLNVAWDGRTRAEDTSGSGVLTDDPDDRQRIGFCVSLQRGDITDYDVSDLQAGWYYDYAFHTNPDRPHGMEYVQMISTKGQEFPSSENFWAGKLFLVILRHLIRLTLNILILSLSTHRPSI